MFSKPIILLIILVLLIVFYIVIRLGAGKKKDIEDSKNLSLFGFEPPDFADGVSAG